MRLLSPWLRDEADLELYAHVHGCVVDGDTLERSPSGVRAEVVELATRVDELARKSAELTRRVRELVAIAEGLRP